MHHGAEGCAFDEKLISIEPPLIVGILVPEPWKPNEINSFSLASKSM